MAKATALTEPMEERTQKFAIIGYQEIPIEKIRPNPHNPRPKFMLEDEDPHILQLGDSIREHGQSRPAVVYELKGHYEHPDEPGRYMLLQGESRWMGCRAAEVPHLRCLIAATPTDPAEEWEWLGNEEAFKREWGTFFMYRFARKLAGNHGLPIAHPNIASMTGLTMDQLRTAEKIFSLEEPIQALTAEYEELLYAQKKAGVRKRSGRLASASGIRSIEFPVTKAALVWDISQTLRSSATMSVAKFDDLELQTRVARWAAKSTTNALEAFLATLVHFGRSPTPGFLTVINNLLDHPDQGLSSVNLAGQNQLRKLKELMKKLDGINRAAKPIINNKSALGSDIDTLKEIRTGILLAERTLRELEDAVRSAIENHGDR